MQVQVLYCTVLYNLFSDLGTVRNSITTPRAPQPAALVMTTAPSRTSTIFSLLLRRSGSALRSGSSSSSSSLSSSSSPSVAPSRAATAFLLHDEPATSSSTHASRSLPRAVALGGASSSNRAAGAVAGAAVAARVTALTPRSFSSGGATMRADGGGDGGGDETPRKVGGFNPDDLLAPLREQVEREMAGLTAKTPQQVALENAAAAAKGKEKEEDAATENATGEWNGPRGPEPTRFGDWERGGRCSDF